MPHDQDTSTERDRRVDEIIAAYLEACAAGQTPDRDQLLTQNPQVAADLASFFADHDAAHRIAHAGRAEAPTVAPGDGTLEMTPLGTIRYLGDYELLEEIARGGMGVVFKARQVSLNRVVAVKMILAGQLAGADEIRRFRVEAEAAAGLDHPGIVPIYEVGEHEGRHYFSMGYVEGPSLAARTAVALMTPREAAELVRTIAEAVHYAHGKGVIHRDLKPANVLLDRDGKPRITDFGLAKRFTSPSGMTATGQVLGTPSYMPPEQAGGELDKVGPHSDIYSLGAILYTLLTGRPPFVAPTPVDTILRVLNGEPTPPRRLQPNLARDLETICLKCLQKNPQARYASAKGLADDLGRFLNGEAIQARPIGAGEKALRWVKRRRKLLLVGLGAAAAGVGLFFLIAGAWNAYQRNAVSSQALTFLRALAEGNEKAMAALLTPKARQDFAQGVLTPLKPGDGATFEVSRVAISGDDAQAEAFALRNGQRQELTLRFRRDHGAWLLHAIDATDQTMRYSLNLERGVGQPLVPFASAEPEPTLEALSLEQFDARWQSDVNLMNEPAGKALERLAGELGLALVHRDDQRAVLLERITWERKGCSHLEAIEHISRQLRLHPRYEGNKLLFASGPRPLPVAFAGPFLVECAEVQQFPPHAIGHVSLWIRGYGLPPSLTARLDRQAVIEKVANARGESLLDDFTGYGDAGWFSSKDVFSLSKSVALKNLLRGVKAVTIRGHIPVKLPTHVETIRLEPATTGAGKQAGKVRVTLSEVGTTEPCRLSLALKGATYKDMQLVARDAAGKPIPQEGTAHFGVAEESHVQTTLSRRPATVEVIVITATKDLQYAFQLDDIPLSRHEEMPDKLSPAVFPGHDAPVTIEFVSVVERGNFTRIRLRAINHSGKPVRRLEMTHVYLDAHSKPLKEFPSSHSGTARDGRPPQIVAAKASAEFTDTAFFMPPEAQSVAVGLRSVEFVDATRWRPDSQKP